MRSFVMALGVATVLGVLPCATTPIAVVVGAEDIPGIAEFKQIDASIAAGGVIEPSAVSELKRRGFRSVINLRLASEREANVEAEGAAVRAAGLSYIHMPLNVGAPDAEAVVARFLEAISNPANLPAYVHSRQAHRVGGLWLIKRVVLDGWTSERALAEAKGIALSDSSRDFVLRYVETHARR